MKKQRLLPLVALAIVPWLFAFIGCSKTSENNGGAPQPNVVSKWTGIFTGTTVDGNVAITLYDDKSLLGNWTADDGSFTFNYSGKYTLADTVFGFNATGTAYFQNISSSFTLTGNGFLNANKCYGTYKIDFLKNEYFTDQTGSCQLNKSN